MSGPLSSRAPPCLGALLVAAGIASWWGGLDRPLHRILRLAPGGRSPAFAAHLSDFGSAKGMIPLALLAVAVLAIRHRRGAASWLFWTIASGRLAVEGIKLLVQRPRPPIADRLELVTSWSFPSSHSAGTMMTCLAITLMAGGRAWMIGAALLAALAIGWTRVALAVHWPGDVLAGWGFGMLWVGAALRWAPPPVLSRGPPSPPA